MPHPLLSSSLMMAPRILLISLAVIVVTGLLSLAWVRGVRSLYPEAWAVRRIRRVFLGSLALWGATIVAQPIVRLLEAPREVRVVVAAIGGMGLVAIGLTAPFLWLGVWLRRRIEARMPVVAVEARTPAVEPSAAVEAGTPAVEPSAAPAPSPRDTREPLPSPLALTRRELALYGARLAPVGGAVVAGVGARQGYALAQVVEIEMAYPDLPPALEGLRILQYSDVHLGYFVDMEEIAALVEQGEKARADLVVLTGDIADDLPLFPRALELFQGLRPRLGVYASIGNHEYYRGIRETRHAYDKSQVPLLLQQGHTIRVGDADLHLSGADDPRFMGRQTFDFFTRTVASTLDGAPSDAFHVLMSHRPEGFVAGRKAGVHLTLSGHTHGAQVGIGGRSILEPLLPDKYMWGPYQEEGARLYTSSGAGHWFPFRLGCPRELPVIKLVRGPITAIPTKRRIA